MNVLAIETATSVCAAAVVSEGDVLAEALLDEKYVHAEKLMTQIDQVLVKSGTSLSRVDCVAVSIGPGSFTGLRIGLGVAKGLVYAIGMPLVPVPTLWALAQRAVDERLATTGDVILAVLDARRDEVYHGYFDVIGLETEPRGEVVDISLEGLVGEMPSGNVIVTGDAKDKVRTKMHESGVRPVPVFVPDSIARCNAGSVGRLGEHLMRTGKTADATTLEPTYIKEFFFNNNHQR